MHSALLLLQHIQILTKTINFSISYNNFCICTKHFASNCRYVGFRKWGQFCLSSVGSTQYGPRCPTHDHERWRWTGSREGLQEIWIHLHECSKQHICCLLRLLHHLRILHLNPARLLVQPQDLHPLPVLAGAQLRYLLLVLALAVRHHRRQRLQDGGHRVPLLPLLPPPHGG